MRSSEFRGTGAVFRFTLIQTVKSKAYIVSLVFFLIIAAFSAPVMQLIKGDPDKTAKVTSSSIETVYICNELPEILPKGTEITDMTGEEAFANVKFTPAEESYDALCDKLEEVGAKCTDVILHIYSAADRGFALEVVRVGGSKVDNDECRALLNKVCENFDAYKVTISGLSEEELKVLNYAYNVEVNYLNDKGEIVPDEDNGIGRAQFGVVYAIMFIVSMVCIMSATQVATAVVTDKSSRVVELLLTSVRPMALLFGKILAMLIATIGQYALFIVVMLSSNKLTEMIFNTKASYLASVLPKGILSNLNIVTALLVILLIALGLVFYATLAGLCGAMVSKMEELQDTLKYFTFLSLIGMYMSIAAIISMQSSADNVFVKFCELFPLSSSMTTPGAFIIDVAPLSYMLIAIAILAVLDLFILRFAAGVYEGLITNMGTNLKIKDVIAMAKNKRKGGAE